jgi:hypothetical protein
MFLPVFFEAILCYSQSGDDTQDNLAKFGYKLNMKIILQNILLYVWLPTWTMQSEPAPHEGWMIMDQETVFCWVPVP